MGRQRVGVDGGRGDAVVRVGAAGGVGVAVRGRAAPDGGDDEDVVDSVVDAVDIPVDAGGRPVVGVTLARVGRVVDTVAGVRGEVCTAPPVDADLSSTAADDRVTWPARPAGPVQAATPAIPHSTATTATIIRRRQERARDGVTGR